jgi:DNA-binding CsgD family transcriptional regulator
LLHTVLGDGSEARTEARTEVRNGPQLTTRFNSVVLRYADAVAHGRAGRVREAAETYASVQDTYPGDKSWMDAHVRRMVATAALHDGWGEPEAWLRQALAWFDARDQPDGAAACRAALRTAGLPVPRAGRVAAATVPDHLRALGVTAREMEVLRLLADGLSNGEIAERLYISHRTVETHVARLLRRTGAHSRAEVLTLTRRPL